MSIKELISFDTPMIELYKRGIVKIDKTKDSISGLKAEDFDLISFDSEGCHNDLKLEVEEFGDTGVYNVIIGNLGRSDKLSL